MTTVPNKMNKAEKMRDRRGIISLLSQNEHSERSLLAKIKNNVMLCDLEPEYSGNNSLICQTTTDFDKRASERLCYVLGRSCSGFLRSSYRQLVLL